MLLADREVLQDQIVETELRNEQLSGENEELRLELQTLGMEKQKVGALRLRLRLSIMNSHKRSPSCMPLPNLNAMLVRQAPNLQPHNCRALPATPLALLR